MQVWKMSVVVQAPEGFIQGRQLMTGFTALSFAFRLPSPLIFRLIVSEGGALKNCCMLTGLLLMLCFSFLEIFICMYRKHTHYYDYCRKKSFVPYLEDDRLL